MTKNKAMSSVAVCTDGSDCGGGGLAVIQTTAQLKNTTFDGNHAFGKGGGVMLVGTADRSTSLYSQGNANTFINNTCEKDQNDPAYAYGGALYLSTSSRYIANSAEGDSFFGNKAGGAGGAVYWTHDPDDAQDDDQFSFVCPLINASACLLRGTLVANDAPIGPEHATPAMSVLLSHAGVTEVSGQTFVDPGIEVQAIDYYGQNADTTADTTMTCPTIVDELPAIETPGFDTLAAAYDVQCSPSGTTALEMTVGYIQFQNMKVSLGQNMTVEVSASLSTTTPEGVSYQLSSSVDISLGSCNVGDALVVSEDDSTRTCIECGDDYYTFEAGAAACDSCPDDKDGTVAYCIADEVRIIDGYWRDSADSTLLRSCQLVGACQGVVSCATVEELEEKQACWNRSLADNDALCRKGHGGPLCGQCKPGYIYNDLRGFCAACTARKTSQNKQVLGYILLAAAVVAFGLFLVRKRIRAFIGANFLFLAALKENFSRYRVKAKIMVTFFQIISREFQYPFHPSIVRNCLSPNVLLAWATALPEYCGGVLNPPWPPAYGAIVRKLGLINLNLVSTAAAMCAVDTNYFWKLFGMTSGPLGLTVLIFFYYVANRLKISLSADTTDPAGPGSPQSDDIPGIDPRSPQSDYTDALELTVIGAADVTTASTDEPSGTILGEDEPGANPQNPPPKQSWFGGAFSNNEGVAAGAPTTPDAEDTGEIQTGDTAPPQETETEPSQETAQASKAERVADLKTLCIGGFLTLSYLVFPSVSLVIFRLFSCDMSISSTEKYLSYLKADMSIQCSHGHSEMHYMDDYFVWMIYAGVMIGFYPVGIPLLYFVVTYKYRHHINPSPLAVLADIRRDDAMGPEHQHAHVEITDDMRLLARVILRVRQRQKNLRDQALAMYTPKKTAQDERYAAEEVKKKNAAKANFFKRIVASSRASQAAAIAYELDHHIEHIPDTWEEYLPGHAAAVADLDAASDQMETSMVVMYRAEDRRVKFLAFL